MTLSTACLLALLSLGASAAPASRPAPASQGRGAFKTSIVAKCTPDSVTIDGRRQASKHPIATALQAAGPGSVIALDPGRYGAFGIGFGHNKPWNARTSGGNPSQPILIHAPFGGVTIAANASQGDTIAIKGDTNPGHITFQNLTIVPGYRAGVIFYKGKWGQTYEGFRFLDCDILGTWDHLANKGGKSTWGIWALGLSDFEFRGVQRRVRVENLRKEHGFYLQNPQGDVLIEDVDARHLGRTFCQFTARKSDGPPGRGTITIRNCTITDVGIARTDAFKGGTALTFAGPLTGTIRLENNVVRAGFDERVQRLTKPDVPYGTSALVVWDYHGGRSGHLILDGNKFEFAPGCGDRPLVSIGACERVEILGTNVFHSGGNQAALVLDPLDPRGTGKLQNSPNGDVHVASGLALNGGIQLRGDMVDEEQRALLARPLPSAD